jgi:hypothetical protein
VMTIGRSPCPRGSALCGVASTRHRHVGRIVAGRSPGLSPRLAELVSLNLTSHICRSPSVFALWSLVPASLPSLPSSLNHPLSLTLAFGLVQTHLISTPVTWPRNEIGGTSRTWARIQVMPDAACLDHL